MGLVAKQRWSCPVHEYPPNDYDGDHWLEPGEVCLDCETGAWMVAKDDHGEPIMVEEGTWASYLRDHLLAHKEVMNQTLVWSQELLAHRPDLVTYDPDA